MYLTVKAGKVIRIMVILDTLFTVRANFGFTKVLNFVIRKKEVLW